MGDRGYLWCSDTRDKKYWMPIL